MKEKAIEHTEGPWFRIGDPQNKTPINAGPKHIAQVSYHPSENEMCAVVGNEHEANAALIAGSPDLYRAAREVIATERAAIDYIKMHGRASYKLTKDAKNATEKLESVINDIEEDAT